MPQVGSSKGVCALAKDTEYIWYASYGSNMSRERFMCYIEGGRPPGAKKTQQRMSVWSEPTHDTEIKISHEMYFAKRARNWGNGGVCFIGPAEPDNNRAETRCRIYRITRQQFIELIADENKADRESVARELKDLDFKNDKSRAFGDGWYNLVLRVGQHGDGYPIWTFTQSGDERDARVAPSPEYITTLVRGLAEMYLTVDTTDPPPENGKSEQQDAKPDLAIPLAKEHAKTSDPTERAEPIGKLITELGNYLFKTIDSEQPTPTTEPSAAWSRQRISELFDDVAPTVMSTEKHDDADRDFRDFVVQLSPRALRTLEHPKQVVVQSRRESGLTTRVLARVSQAEEKVAEGTIRMDQKLRQAIGVLKNDKVRKLADTVTVSAPKDEDDSDHRPFWSWIRRKMRKWGGTQPQIMRVVHARFEDMEINLCRFPLSGFDVLGCECGDSVTIVSPRTDIRIRALAATEVMCKKRVESERDDETIRVHAPWKLSLHRLEDKNADIPSIYLDADARNRLRVKPCDPVLVERSVLGMFTKQSHLFAMTFILGSMMVLLDYNAFSEVVFADSTEGPALLNLFSRVIIFGGVLFAAAWFVLRSIRSLLT